MGPSLWSSLTINTLVNKQIFDRLGGCANEFFIYVLKILKKLILAHFSKSKNMSSLVTAPQSIEHLFVNQSVDG